LFLSIIEISQAYFGRKILQVNSSSDTSQPSFIALLCVIAVLTIVLVIIIIILYCRYYSHRKRISKDPQEHPNKFRRIFCIENNPQSTVPVSITRTSTSSSSHSVKSFKNLFSNPQERHQIPSVNTLPSRHLQQTTIDAYFKDLTLFPSGVIDIKQLNSYLFIDLHSTSSETYPDNVFKQFTNNTITNDYETSTEHANQRKHRAALPLKRSQAPRFLMRERYLPTNLPKLPQLRHATMQQQRYLYGMNDSNSTSQSLPSTKIFTTKNDYDDSHSYHMNQNQILQTIKEERPSVHSPYPLHYEDEPYGFEIISTSLDDESDIQIPSKSSPIINNRTAFMNDSIIV
jgi:hypothetical protein